MFNVPNELRMESMEEPEEVA